MLFLVAIIFVQIIWLSLLSFFFFQLFSRYDRVIRQTNALSFNDVLTVLLRDVSMTRKDIERVKSRCDTIEKEEQFHMQKIGLLRFNPFEDTGGDQSFILALLDGRNTGVVISGLYSRSGTRWYAKKVTEGKGVEHELSEHEKKALKEAK